MSNITVVRDDKGKLNGLGEKDRKAWARFVKVMRELEPGELFQVSFWFPREGWKHRKHFALLAQVFDAQEQFADSEQLRMWLEVGAGHCEFVPGPTGRMVALPKSIAFSKMDDADFEAHHEAVKAFLRSDHCQRFLWPHLTPAQTNDTIEGILEPFEQVGG